MPRPRLPAPFWPLCLLACSTQPPVSQQFASLCAEAPQDATTRLWVQGNQIVRAAVAVGPGAMPPVVRTAVDAVAPQGELLFQGREWGPRGAGFRVDKRYREGAEEHVRTTLIAEDGRVLERAHSVPVGRVPSVVLAAATKVATQVDEVLIVSGPTREEHWLCTVRDRIGRVWVVVVALDGTELGILRRLAARLDV